MNTIETDLQRGVVATAGRVEGITGLYDRVPAKKAYDFPYATIRQIQVLDDGIQGLTDDGHDRDENDVEAFVTIDVWGGTTVGKPLAQDAAAPVRDALSAPFPIGAYQINSARCDASLSLDDPDGVMTRVELVFRYLISKIPT